MRYTFFYDEKGQKALGFYYEDGVVALKNIAQNITDRLEPADAIHWDDSTKEKMNALYQDIKAGKVQAEKKDYKLAPLVLDETANVFCVGRNYKSTYADMNKATQKNIEKLDRPAFFYKPNRAVVQSGGEILYTEDDTKQLDYEGEIGIVIAKSGKNIKVEDAESYIYGYTVCNDVSARDAMKAYYQMYKGKTMDTFAPIGPCIVTKDEITNPKEMHITLKVNDELRQDGCTSDLVFDFPTLIYFLSKSMTLKAGDIIFTGTPAGIGAAMDPPRFLKDGDKLEISVDQVGVLKNTIRDYSL